MSAAKLTFISAGAGSGKTYRLTRILHQELASGRARPAGVIATTFTVKAATELRERVRAHLLDQGSFALASEMGQARIGTVNSVCGALLERFAFEAGIAPNQQVLEDEPAQAMLNRAIDSVSRDESRQTFLATVRRLGLVDSWRDSLAELVKVVRANGIALADLPAMARDNAATLLGHFGNPVDADLDGDIRGAIAAALPSIGAAAQAAKPVKLTKDYVTLLRGFVHAMDNGGAPWGEWVKLSKVMPEAGLKAIAAPIAELAARVGEHSGLHADIGEFLTQVFFLAGRALQAFQREKQELGVIDFTDQEALVLDLLDNPVVHGAIREELDLLLVDEFQDTSPIQLAVFLKLAALAKAVYWVGDVKQAIYGFRGSDTQLMESVVQALPRLGGTKEILDRSYRSRFELVAIVNAVFEKVFQPGLRAEEISLTAARSEALATPVLANWILGGKNKDQEARSLATGIRRLVAEGHAVLAKGEVEPHAVRYGDIAVLARSNEYVGKIAATLAGYGIPTATARAGLMATAEATLAMACLRRLNDPSDTLATAQILSLGDCAAPEAWIAARMRHLSAGGDEDSWLEEDFGAVKAHPLIGALAMMRESLPLLSPREALETVITQCDIGARVVRWSPDPDLTRTRLANLEALLALADKYEDLCRSGRHAASISGLIIWLEELVQKNLDKRSEPAIDAVRVLTHHGAKGLEWPVVILMDLDSDAKTRLWDISTRAIKDFDANEPLANRAIRYWPWPFGAQKKVPVADAIALTPEAQDFRRSAVGEASRLLYVSMTRARDLMILARSSRNPQGEWISSLDAPWLLHGPGEESITLPDGNKVAATCWTLDPPDDGANAIDARDPLRWFPPPVGRSHRLPLACAPSGAGSGSAAVLEKVPVGTRIAVAGTVDMAQLGNAIHACIAASFAAGAGLPEVGEIDGTLAGFGVADAVAGKAVQAQIAALHGWIAQRWPGAQGLAECPVQSCLPSGQVLTGRTDLILQTGSGWILIDHKASAAAVEGWDHLAAEYTPQLAAYAEAIAAATATPVREAWLYLPVAAGAVRVDLKEAKVRGAEPAVRC